MIVTIRDAASLTAAVLVFTAAAAPVQAQPDSSQLLSRQVFVPENMPRHALVIGVENYDHLDKVPNALNDAAAMARELRGAGFSSMRHLQNPTSTEILDYVDELALLVNKNEGPAIIVFFFAGHGFQNDAFNYLAAAEARKDRVFSDGLPVATIVEKLARRRAGLAIFFLDACRTPVPLSPEGAAPDGRPRPAGFVAVPPGPGAVLSVAAQFGTPARSAATEGDTHSPFTKSLVRYLSRRSLSLDAMLDQVIADVMELTHDNQIPAQLKEGAVGGTFFFVPQQAERDAEARAWQVVVETDQPGCVRRYIRTYPDSGFVIPALRWMATMPSGGAPCPGQ